MDEVEQLSLAGVKRFSREYVGQRVKGPLNESSQYAARNAIHAWACALCMIGEELPQWSQPLRRDRLPRVIEEYIEYRRVHRGVSSRTIDKDVDIATTFLSHLRVRGRRVSTARVVDIDAFVATLSSRLSRRSVATACSVLRGFLRYLRTNGQVRAGLADSVVSPRGHSLESPHRALPWADVQRLVFSIDRNEPIGKRDFAMLLLMAFYGLGAAEVLNLRIDDVDWESLVLTVRRPKTGVAITLPLLPPVAKAVADYLKAGRPRDVTAREIFLARGIPHSPLTSGGIRHRIRKYAKRSGIKADMLGAHVLRHSHVTRQVDLGADTKVVSDILGHRRPSSTSAYIRVALRRLRAVSLPVPS